MARTLIDEDPPNESFAVLEEPEGEFTPEKEAIVVLSGSGAAPEDISGWGEAVNDAGTEFTIFEYDDVICMVEAPRGPKLCGSTELAEGGELFLVTPVSCEAVRVTGLVPNGIDEVELEQKGRSGVPAAVVSNVYEAELPAEKTTVSAEGQAGTVELPLRLFAPESPGCNRL